jgi:hypothetical protein
VNDVFTNGAKKKVPIELLILTRSSFYENIEKVEKRELDVVVKNKIDSKVSIPVMIIEENERKFEIIAQEEISKKLFLKIDEDDPPYKFPDDLSFEPRKETEKEMMEEATCHGAAIGT